jgi:hypothetical protein
VIGSGREEDMQNIGRIYERPRRPCVRHGKAGIHIYGTAPRGQVGRGGHTEIIGGTCVGSVGKIVDTVPLYDVSVSDVAVVERDGGSTGYGSPIRSIVRT